MRYLLLLLTLTGCGLNSEYRANQEREELAGYQSKCDQLGIQRGTRDHQDCALRMYEAQRAPR